MREVLKNFTQASWRGTTWDRGESDRIGVSFDAPDGQVIRLFVDPVSAMHLVETLADYLGIGVQSPRSAEMPRVEGSVVPGQSV